MAITSFLFPFIFDLTGTFTSVFIAGAVICAVSLVIMERLRIFSKNRG